MNRKALQTVFFILILIYMISPVDLMPGPLDDIIVMLIGLYCNQRFPQNAGSKNEFAVR